MVPLIQTQADALTARAWGGLHTESTTWLFKPGNEELETLAQSGEEFLNQEARSTFDVLTPTYDWIDEMVVIGRSVLTVQWRRRMAHRWTPGAKKPTLVSLGASPQLIHIPAERILWERDRSIMESNIVVQQSHLNWTDLTQRVITAGWDRAAVEASQASEGIDGASGRILQAKRSQDGQRESSGYQEPHDIREVWIDWSMAQLLTRGPTGNAAPEFADAGDAMVPIVVTLHKKAKQVYRTVAHPYFFWRWPFLDIYFRRNGGRGGTRGIAKSLENMQRAMTTSLNQAIDSDTLSNSIPFFTTNPRMKNLRITPHHPIFTESLGDIQEAKLTSRPVSSITIIQTLQAMSERLSGMADINFGRETRLGGHPAPATNTLAQLEEGSKVLNASLKLVHQQLSTAGEWAFTMYQQFGLGSQDALARKLGAADAERLAQLPITPDTISFGLHAMSKASNQDQERNNAILVTQVTANYYSFVLRMLGLVENPQTTPTIREGAMKAIDAFTRTYSRFLQASEIDDAENFTLALQEARAGDAAQIAQFRDFATAQLAGRGGPPQGAAGPVPNGGVGFGGSGAEALLPADFGADGLIG